WHIARYTAADPAAGLPDADMLATDIIDLQLHHPWDIDTETAAAIALQVEDAAREVSPLVTNTDGASVGTFEGHFLLGNTRGFLGGFPFSRHTISIAPIAGSGNNMQRDYRSEEHTSELQSRENLVCRLLLEKKKIHHCA